MHIADSLLGIVKTHYKASIFQYKLNTNLKKSHKWAKLWAEFSSQTSFLQLI